MKYFVVFVALGFQNNDGSQKITGDQLKDLYKSFVDEYPIVSIEDPFDQDDWEHYTKLTCEIGEKVQIVGDDLLVTNPKVTMGFMQKCFLAALDCALYFPRKTCHNLSMMNADTVALLPIFVSLAPMHFQFCLQRVEKAIKEKACNALLLKV